MNIAFPALLVFLLALPGIILRSSYREWGWRFPVYRLPIGEEVAKSLFSAAALNAVWCALVQCFGYRVVFKDVLILFVGGTGLPPNLWEQRLTAVADHSIPIAAYFLTLYLGAGILGFVGRQLVRNLRLDLRYPLIRFDNFWHYALNAELPLFWENRDAYAQIAGVPVEDLPDQEVVVRLSCVVNHGSNSFVYEGTPFDYFFDRAGGLEKIIVRDVTYERLYDFPPPAVPPINGAVLPATPISPALSVEAGVFILTAADMHNIGIQYFFLPEESESGQGNITPAE